MSLTNIYILKLEGGNYYVGKTDNPTKRYQEHVDGKGSAWTRKWPPVAVEKIVPNAGPFDEDKYTKEMMLAHGIEKVRGGSYVRVDLEPTQVENLTKELRGATDKCSECGKGGHFVRSCPLLADKKKNYDLKEKCSVGRAETVVKCSTCNRIGHWASTCYAKTDKDGNELLDEEESEEEEGSEEEEDQWECGKCKRTFTTRFGCILHMKACSSKEKKTNACYRCGRKGHFSPDCYAKVSINGKLLE